MFFFFLLKPKQDNTQVAYVCWSLLIMGLHFCFSHSLQPKVCAESHGLHGTYVKVEDSGYTVM